MDIAETPLTLTDAAAALRAGTVTSVGLYEQTRRRADALDEELGVYLHRFDGQAREWAERADADFAAGVDRGPLQGIPVGVKDLLAMAEGPTTAQSLVLDPEWGANRDAIVVERLKEAGAVITGKLTAAEFGLGFPDAEKPFPTPRNPWDPERYAGGSSSGSGSGVAAGMILAALGTDAGGSIRIPAIFCGVSGLMPTFGRVPTAGSVPLGYSLDHIGPLARSARDCGAFLDVIAGDDRRDPYAVDLPAPDLLADADGSLTGVRIGVDRVNHFREGDDPAVAPAFDAALDVLRGLGAAVVEIEIPLYAETVIATSVTASCEALAYHMPDLRERWDDYFAGTRLLLGSGVLYSGADYVQAQRVRRAAQRGLAELLNDVDLIATPGATQGAISLEALAEGGAGALLSAVHTVYWDGVGNPALVVPMGFTADRLPLSLQLAARPFDEALLVRAGDAYQAVTDWHLQVPEPRGDRAPVDGEDL